ncbi:hypothetical protein TSUD_259270 [Trifolium subterraneum]|uniref:Uncharacterized protein n=1 Tax=Trifolium subterraneum TaxID=3900 RepID=A0A2Z6NXP0_TRISU|nr:hypothetical protein TSUD_259270 [Trifolium subterraneum]
MEQCQSNKMAFIKGAALEALQTAKKVASDKKVRRVKSPVSVTGSNFSRRDYMEGDSSSGDGDQTPTSKEAPESSKDPKVPTQVLLDHALTLTAFKFLTLQRGSFVLFKIQPMRVQNVQKNRLEGSGAYHQAILIGVHQLIPSMTRTVLQIMSSIIAERTQAHAETCSIKTDQSQFRQPMTFSLILIHKGLLKRFLKVAKIHKLFAWKSRFKRLSADSFVILAMATPLIWINGQEEAHFLLPT